MKKTAVLWLAVLAILFAQTLQSSLRVFDADSTHGHTAALHVQGGAHVGGGTDDAPNGGHFANPVVLKKSFGDSLAPALITLIVLFLLPPAVPAYRPVPVVVSAYRDHRRRPPLRAPPR